MLTDMAQRDYSADTVIARFDNRTPNRIDTIEWFASVEDTRQLLRALAGPEMVEARAIMAINPGLPRASFKGWDYVGFKGGSEPGVLNLTWLLRGQDGSWHMLTLHWNDTQAPVEEARLLGIAQRVLALP